MVLPARGGGGGGRGRCKVFDFGGPVTSGVVKRHPQGGRA